MSAERARGDDAKQFVRDLRREREAQGLSPADVSERSGNDKSASSRPESGQQPNPIVDTLSRSARVLGKRHSWALE